MSENRNMSEVPGAGVFSAADITYRMAELEGLPCAEKARHAWISSPFNRS
jgi:hypothetical protein